MDRIARLEHRLAEHFGRAHCILTGRGATALWLVMELIRQPGKHVVVLPATLCLSPAVVARFVGLELAFCDVNPETGNVCPDSLESLLAGRRDICAVLGAHVYGQPADVDRLKQICGKHRIVLIEDVAQALGASLCGRPLGGFGDVAVLSFGHTKIIDAGDGGALLTDDDALAAALRSSAAGLSPKSAQCVAWAEHYRRAYYALAPIVASQPRLGPLLGNLGAAFPEMYRYAASENIAERVDAVWDTLDQVVEHRQAMAGRYAERLRDLPVTLLKTSGSGVPWRFSFRVSQFVRDRLLDQLRLQKFDASSWYPALPPFFAFSENWRNQWPGAATIEAEIVNLWVDASVDAGKVRACCDVAARALIA